MRDGAQQSGNHVLSSLLLEYFSPTEYIFFSISTLKYCGPLVGLHVHLPLHAMLGSGLSLHRACSSCYNHCEFICTAALLCPENALPCVGSPLLTFTVFILPLPYNDPGDWRDTVHRFYLGLRICSLRIAALCQLWVSELIITPRLLY